MTQNEIIDMARHIAITFGTRMCDENGHTHGEELYAMGIDEIVEAIKFVAAKEREACAKVCEANVWGKPVAWWGEATKSEVSVEAGLQCAAAIRARGQA